MTTTHDCHDDTVALRNYRAAKRAQMRRELTEALTQGPATTKELQRRCGTHPARYEYSYLRDGVLCNHLSDDVQMQGWLPSDLQAELVRREKRGEAARAKVPGWQAHLWWAT